MRVVKQFSFFQIPKLGEILFFAFLFQLVTGLILASHLARDGFASDSRNNQEQQIRVKILVLVGAFLTSI